MPQDALARALDPSTSLGEKRHLLIAQIQKIAQDPSSSKEEFEQLIQRLPHDWLPMLVPSIWDAWKSEERLDRLLNLFYDPSRFGGPSDPAAQELSFQKFQDPLVALWSKRHSPSVSWLKNWAPRAQRAYQSVFAHGRRPLFHAPDVMVDHLVKTQKWEALGVFCTHFVLDYSSWGILMSTPVFGPHLDKSQLSVFQLSQMASSIQADPKTCFDSVADFEAIIKQFARGLKENAEKQQIQLHQSAFHPLAVNIYTKAKAQENSEHLRILQTHLPEVEKWVPPQAVFEMMCFQGKTHAFEKYRSHFLSGYDFRRSLLMCLCKPYRSEETHFTSDFLHLLVQRHQDLESYPKRIKEVLLEVSTQKIDSSVARVEMVKKWLGGVSTKEKETLLKNAVLNGQMWLPKVILLHFPEVSTRHIHRISPKIEQDFVRLTVQADRKHLKKSVSTIKPKLSGAKRKM